MPIGMAGGARCARCGSVRVFGSHTRRGCVDCLGWRGRRRSFAARRRDQVESTERVDQSETRDPGGPVEANGLVAGRRCGFGVDAEEVSDPVRAVGGVSRAMVVIGSVCGVPHSYQRLPERRISPAITMTMMTPAMSPARWRRPTGWDSSTITPASRRTGARRASKDCIVARVEA